MTAKTITFGSLKGGAGKTKVSTNVAAELSLRGHKVLIIDADPQGTTTRAQAASILMNFDQNVAEN